jgi:hypothetical protein
MKMNMENRLAGAGIVVDNNPEALGRHPPFTGNPGGNPVNMPDQPVIFRLKVKGIVDMLPGNDKKMNRRHRRNILDYNDLVILKNLFRWNFTLDYSAKQAIFHFFTFHPS